jgi:hypothetical protein
MQRAESDERTPPPITVIGPPPLWTRLGFAWATAAALLGLAVGVLFAAVGSAFPSEGGRTGVPMRIGPSVGLMILAMLLVVAAIAVPLVIRRKAQVRGARRALTQL